MKSTDIQSAADLTEEISEIDALMVALAAGAEPEIRVSADTHHSWVDVEMSISREAVTAALTGHREGLISQLQALGVEYVPDADWENEEEMADAAE